MLPIFQSTALSIITIFTVFVSGLYFYFTRNFNFWKKLGIPHIKPLPFVGSIKELVFLKIGIGQYLQKIYYDFKDDPYVGIFAFDQPGLVIRDLNLVKKILVKDAQIFIDRIITFNEVVDPFFGKTMFTLKGQRWRHMRVNVTPVFTSGKMKKMFCLVEKCAQELVHYLDKAIDDRPTVEVKEAMARFTTDVIASCAFGIDSNSLRNPDAEFRHYLRKVFGASALKQWAILMAFFPSSVRNLLRLQYLDDETSDFIRRTVWNTVEHRQKHGIIRNDFLDCMIELRNKGKMDISGSARPVSSQGFKIDGDDLVAQAFAFLAAGFETSATTLSFALYELALQPNIQERLRAEMTQVLSKHQGELTYDGMNEMSYLDMVISETLRKYPVLPFLDRQCVSDYKLPDPSGKETVTLPAGTAVYIPIMAIQNDPKYFPEPQKFDPERFTEEKKQSRPNYTYFPFGDGPRVCIGMRFGIMQIKSGLIHILSRFEVAPCKNTPVSIVFDPKAFLLSVTSEIPLSFNRRRSDLTSG